MNHEERVTQYGEFAIEASRIVDDLRDANPDKEYIWSLPTNYSEEYIKYPTYVCFWEIIRRERESHEPIVAPTVKFIFNGQLSIARRVLTEAKLLNKKCFI